jgi:holo-[acyl-carrier protein] synthase
VIVGIGVDAVSVARMRRVLDRTPKLADRLFTPHERDTASRRGSAAASLAARFAAKEACRKALRAVIPWRDVEVVSDEGGVPRLRVAGHAHLRFHLSLTHTSDLAMAVVVAEQDAAAATRSR